jgi:hypothetical protein
MKMVERMARAILIKARLDGRPMDKRLSIDYALAALNAMREPTEEMLGRGQHFYDKTVCGLMDTNEPMLAAWDEMIATAIKEAEAK